METVTPTPLFTPEHQLTEMHSRPPYGRLRRWVPMAWTVILLWLQWRWLRVKRRVYGVDAMAEETHRFHMHAAEAVVIDYEELPHVIRACGRWRAIP